MLQQFQRTSNSLNAGLTIKWLDKRFKENAVFCGKGSWFCSRLICKKAYRIGQVLIEKYGLKTLFERGSEKRVLKAFQQLLHKIHLCLLYLCTCLYICALWSPAGKVLTSLLSFVVYNCEFVTFPLVSWVRCGT